MDTTGGNHDTVVLSPDLPKVVATTAIPIMTNRKENLPIRTQFCGDLVDMIIYVYVCGTLRSWGHLRPKISLVPFCMKTQIWRLKSPKMFSLMTKNAKKCGKMV